MTPWGHFKVRLVLEMYFELLSLTNIQTDKIKYLPEMQFCLMIHFISLFSLHILNTNRLIEWTWYWPSRSLGGFFYFEVSSDTYPRTTWRLVWSGVGIFQYSVRIKHAWTRFGTSLLFLSLASLFLSPASIQIQCLQHMENIWHIAHPKPIEGEAKYCQRNKQYNQTGGNISHLFDPRSS